MLQSSLFLPVDQLLPETQPSTILSHTLNFVAVLFYVYIFFFIYILLYSGAKKSNNSRIVTRHQFACTPPWKRNTELAWETTLQEESSLCRSKGEQAQLCAGEGLTCQARCQGRSPRLHVLLLRQTRRSSSLCAFPSAKAQQGPAGTRELLLLHPALSCSHFPPLQLCWQQMLLGLHRGQGPAPCVVQTVDPRALGVRGTFHSSGSGGVVQGNNFLSAPLKCLNTGTEGSASCPVLFLEPGLGVASLQKTQKDFHCNVGCEFWNTPKSAKT